MKYFTLSLFVIAFFGACKKDTPSGTTTSTSPSEKITIACSRHVIPCIEVFHTGTSSNVYYENYCWPYGGYDTTSHAGFYTVSFTCLQSDSVVAFQPYNSLDTSSIAKTMIYINSTLTWNTSNPISQFSNLRQTIEPGMTSLKTIFYP